MQAGAIVLWCIGAAIGYGIIHDQITARICIEYFTIAHPRIIDSEDPAALAFLWGVIATWWVGAILGTLLAAASRLGSWPKRSVAELVRPIFWLMAASAAAATLAGTLGWIFAPEIGLPEFWAYQIPPEHHAAFLADALAHLASYGMGFLGGLFIIIRVIRSRRKQASASPN